MARKSNAQKAAEAAAAQAADQATQELGKIEIVDGEKVVTDQEPASRIDVDATGEDLGDVSEDVSNDPVIEADEATEASEALDPTESIIDDAIPAEADEPVQEPEQESLVTPELANEITKQIDEEIIDQLVKTAEVGYELEDGFTPTLRPTMVGELYTGYIACPRAAFEAVQVEGWQFQIDTHPAKQALKSILHWKNINGSATVRCMSSSKFADVK